MQLYAYYALRTGQMKSMCKGYANAVQKGPQYIHDTFSPSRRKAYINDYYIYDFVL